MNEAGEQSSLAQRLRDAGVPAALARRLAQYGTLLLAANRAVNLTGAKDGSALVPHLLDALTLAGDVREPLIDVGAGGGLPGIPLALVAGIRITLLEPIAKKAAFLREALDALAVAGEVIAERAEIAARDERYRERFASATARAVGSAPTVAELTVPFLSIGGRALLQRGALDERERHAVADAAPMLGATLIEERPLDGERRLLVLEKQIPTPGRFPRRNGVPEKRPLCL